MLQKTGFVIVPYKVLVGMLLAIFMISVSCKPAGQNKSNNGFVKIFDGKTLNGWVGDSTYWRVENGNLVGEITPTTVLKTNSFIIWQGGKPADFELALEFKISKA